MANKFIDETGNVYGRLTVLERASTKSHKGLYWVCKCSCGNVVNVSGTHLRGTHGSATKSCGCLIKEKPIVPNAPIKKSYQSLIGSARDRGFTVTITYENFVSIVMQNCKYCGLQPYDKHYDQRKLRDNVMVYNGVDRVDSSLGYHLDNCVPCCTMCNRMKLDSDVTAFLQKVAEIYRHNFEEE